MYFYYFFYCLILTLQYRVAPITEVTKLQYPGPPQTGVSDVRQLYGEGADPHLVLEGPSRGAQESDGGLLPGLGTGDLQLA